MFKYKYLCKFSLALLLSSLAVAQAQNYPNRPVRIIVAFAPGGANDIVTRVVAQKLTEIWGQSIVVDNRGGAGGNIGGDLAAKANPDGQVDIAMVGKYVQIRDSYISLNEALIQYHTHYKADARILPSVQKNVAWMWGQWNATGEGFQYTPNDPFDYDEISEHQIIDAKLIAESLREEVGREVAALKASHGLTPGEVGFWFGVGGGIAGIFGTWLGGWLANRYGKHNRRHVVTAPAIGMALAIPFAMLGFQSENWSIALAFLLANLSLQYGATRLPANVTSVRFTTDELASVCPVTQQPDLSHVVIQYVPHQWCIESKSLKLYLWSFRDRAVFAEALAAEIAGEVMLSAKPKHVKVTLTQRPRGGIEVQAIAELTS